MSIVSKWQILEGWLPRCPLSHSNFVISGVSGLRGLLWHWESLLACSETEVVMGPGSFVLILWAPFMPQLVWVGLWLQMSSGSLGIRSILRFITHCVFMDTCRVPRPLSGLVSAASSFSHGHFQNCRVGVWRYRMEVPLPAWWKWTPWFSSDVGILPQEKISDICTPLVPESLGQWTLPSVHHALANVPGTVTCLVPSTPSSSSLCCGHWTVLVPPALSTGQVSRVRQSRYFLWIHFMNSWKRESNFSYFQWNGISEERASLLVSSSLEWVLCLSFK